MMLALEELQERRKAAKDGESVAWRWRRGPDTRWHLASSGDLAGEVEPLYRHAQPAPERDQYAKSTPSGHRLPSVMSARLAC